MLLALLHNPPVRFLMLDLFLFMLPRLFFPLDAALLLLLIFSHLLLLTLLFMLLTILPFLIILLTLSLMFYYLVLRLLLKLPYAIISQVRQGSPCLHNLDAINRHTWLSFFSFHGC